MRIDNRSGALTQEATLAHQSGREQSQRQQYRQSNACEFPPLLWLRRAHHEKTQPGKGDQASGHAQVAAAASGERDAEVANCARVSRQQLQPNRPPTPAGHADSENADDLEQTSQVIWTNIKAAGPRAVVHPLQERNQHEVIARSELNHPDHHVDQRASQQQHENHGPRPRRSHGNNRQPIYRDPA